MQPVSQTYNPYPADRTVDAEIAFKLVDTQAARNAAPAAAGADPVSNLAQIIREENRAGGRWSTLEPGLWLLDGTFHTLPETLDQEPMGLWTQLSGDDGTFDTSPLLTLTLSEPASSVGFTLHFDDQADQWPGEVGVQVWLGGTLLAEKTLQNYGPTMLIDLPLDGYDKVAFTFLKTAWPRRRVRLYSVLFGIVQKFTGASLVSAAWTAGASAGGESLPARELVFTFDNGDQKYNLINPNGLYRYLQDGQEIDSALLIGGEKISMGVHHFQKAEAKDGALTAEITASDRILWLDSESYEVGADGFWPLTQAVAAVLGEKIPLDMPAALGARLVNRCIPKGTTKREALRFLAQAARCACWMGRDGVLLFRELTLGEAVDTLDGTNLETMDGVSVTQPVDKVVLRVVNEFYWSGVEEAIKTQTKEYTAGTGNHVLTVQNPCAYDGQAVAAWLLETKKRRLRYTCTGRGNPALEVGDTVTIFNAYDEAGPGAVTGYEAVYDGGLTETLEALGPAWAN